MKFTDIFLRRPVLAIVVNLVIIIAGLQAVSSLTVRQYPKTENASVTVTTVYVGANADLVKGFVTTPLERSIAAADGIDYIESQSSQGVSQITARLKLDYDANKALSEIGSRVDQVRGDLPPEAQIPVIGIESADSRFAAAYLSFSSEFLEQNEITDYLVREVQPRLSAIEGVQRADILGARTFAMRVWLDPAKMAAFNVSPAQVRQALGANNYLSPVGSTKGALIEVNLSANTALSSVGEFEQLVIREQDGALVRLGDIADISLGAEDYNTEVRFSGTTATFMGIWVLPNANSLDVLKRVRAEMKEIDKDLPDQIKATVAFDGTKYIQSAIDDVVRTLVETLILVIIVIFLFLGSLRSVLVPIVAIPVSLIGTIFLMQIFGFTINLLTLLAVVLSVGLVVDDAIVVVENVERNLQLGMTPFKAATVGARELVGPIISMTVTLAAVYAPIGFQGGLTGSLFREFAFTLAGAVTISGVVALTLSPLMASRLLRKGDDQKGLARYIHKGFGWLRERYARSLRRSLNARAGIYVIWIGLSIVAGIFFTMSAKELAPTEDQGVVFGIVDTPADTTVEALEPSINKINEHFFSIPETAYTFQVTSPGGGFSGMGLKPWDERERSVFEIKPEIEPKLASVTGVRVFPVLPPALPGGGQFPVEFIISSTDDTKDVLKVAEAVQKKAVESEMFAFPPLIDVKIDKPQAEIVFDRDKVAELGLTLQQVGSEVASVMGGNFVNRFSIDGRSYKVIPQIQRSARLNPDQLKDIYVSGGAYPAVDDSHH